MNVTLRRRTQRAAILIEQHKVFAETVDHPLNGKSSLSSPPGTRCTPAGGPLRADLRQPHDSVGLHADVAMGQIAGSSVVSKNNSRSRRARFATAE